MNKAILSPTVEAESHAIIPHKDLHDQLSQLVQGCLYCMRVLPRGKQQLLVRGTN